MSDRYLRLYTLPNNLYSNGSPVLIVAGALLKDSYTGKVLAQLKFRNISGKVIKSLKIKINAYDTAKDLLNGIDDFAYLDLSVAADDEFGQNVPVYLPNNTTRSFSVEILSAVYTDNTIYAPAIHVVAEAAPLDILEEINRIDNEKRAKESEVKAVQDKENAEKRKRMFLMLGGIASLLFALVSIVIIFVPYLVRDFSGKWSLTWPIDVLIGRYWGQCIFAVVAPFICIFASTALMKKHKLIKGAAFVCLALVFIQILAMIGHARIPVLHELGQYVNCTESFFKLTHMLQAVKDLGHGNFILPVMKFDIAQIICGVLSNVVPTVALFVCSLKNK